MLLDERDQAAQEITQQYKLLEENYPPKLAPDISKPTLQQHRSQWFQKHNLQDTLERQQDKNMLRQQPQNIATSFHKTINDIEDYRDTLINTQLPPIPFLVPHQLFPQSYDITPDPKWNMQPYTRTYTQHFYI